MDIERSVESLILDLNRRSLPLDQVHAVLLQVADLTGQRPRTVTGPESTFDWRLADRGIAVTVARRHGGRSLSFSAFDWAERDDEYHRAFKWAEAPDLPYLWNLPIAGGQQWWPGAAVASGWDTFFDCFGPCLDDLPTDLQSIPPQWRPRGVAVTSMWNVEGPVVGGVSVAVSAENVVINGEGPAGFELRIPADRLGAGQVSVPAILAGLTATGSVRELEFWENETSMDVFPVGRQAGEWDEDEPEESPAVAPKATLSVDQARALLDEAPVASPPERPSAGGGPFTPTMPVTDARELASQLALYNGDAPAVLRAWGVELDDQGRGMLKEGSVRCRVGEAEGGYAVRVALASDRTADDLDGTWRYGNELSNALMERFGPPAGTVADSDSSGSRWWKVAGTGIRLRVDRRGVALSVASWRLEFLGLIGAA